eukprot:4001241-Pyramimonas_sp.AAC.1
MIDSSAPDEENILSSLRGLLKSDAAATMKQWQGKSTSFDSEGFQEPPTLSAKDQKEKGFWEELERS